MPFTMRSVFLLLAAVGACGGVQSNDGPCIADASTDEAAATPCTPCGSSCVDLSSDTHNCNRCGHDCLGGACSAGVCQPVALVDGQYNAAGLAIDLINVYWTNEVSKTGSVLKASKDSIPNTVVVPVAAGLDNPVAVVVDATTIAWADAYPGGSVMSAATYGGGSTSLGSLAGTSAEGVAMDATNVYWTADADSGFVMKTPRAGGPSVALASAQPGPYSIAVDATNVYWTNQNDGSLMRVALGGGSPTAFDTTNARAHRIAVDASRIYWTSYFDHVVMAAPLGGGTSAIVASGQAHVQGIFVDADFLYWTTQAAQTNELGTVVMAPITGGSPITLANVEEGAFSVVADENAVYWTTYRKVMKVAKP